MRELARIDEFDSKTPEGVRVSWMGSVLVTYADGTFMGWLFESQYDDVTVRLMGSVNEFATGGYDVEDAIALGILTAEERAQLRRQYEDERLATIERSERAQYERLAKRFGHAT